MKLYLNALAIYTLLVIAMGAAKVPGHAAAGIVLGILSLGLIRHGWAGWTAVGVAALELVPAYPVLHACLAPTFFSIVMFLRTEPQVATVQNKTIFWLGAAAPATVFAQIALGAAYRHKVWGVMPHMGGAAIAVSVTLILSLLLIQNHTELRRPSITLLTVVLIQISLGIASFILRLIDLDSTVWFVVLSTAHVTVAAMLLGAATSLGHLIVGNPAAHR